ncbi:MAG: hypothetical protein Q7J07_02330 [Pelolinea sp.]|nr:hypothetical protein [Pelolinea sp.]
MRDPSPQGYAAVTHTLRAWLALRREYLRIPLLREAPRYRKGMLRDTARVCCAIPKGMLRDTQEYAVRYRKGMLCDTTRVCYAIASLLVSACLACCLKFCHIPLAHRLPTPECLQGTQSVGISAYLP